MCGRKCHLRKPICPAPACPSCVELSRARMYLSTQGQLFTHREGETPHFKSHSRVEILRLETLAPELRIPLSRGELTHTKT